MLHVVVRRAHTLRPRVSLKGLVVFPVGGGRLTRDRNRKPQPQKKAPPAAILPRCRRSHYTC